MARAFERQWIQRSIDRNDKTVLEFGSRILPRYIPFIITSREKNYFVSPAGNKVITVCNHEEAHLSCITYFKSWFWCCWRYRCPYFNDLGIFKVKHKKWLVYDHINMTIINLLMFLPWQNIVFEFAKNTCLNSMWYHIFFLPSWENWSIQKFTWSTRFMFSIVTVRKLLSDH